jgi:hypothetical protein
MLVGCRLSLKEKVCVGIAQCRKSCLGKAVAMVSAGEVQLPALGIARFLDLVATISVRRKARSLLPL